MRRWLLSVLLTLTTSVAAEPLDDAIALVLDQSPVVAGHELELRAIGNQRDWESRVRLSYAAQSTDDIAEGLNARFELVIPLFDRSREIDAARARQQLAVAEQNLVDAFLGEVRELSVQYTAQNSALEMTALQKDRLEYRKQQERDGQLSAAELWPDAERAKQAEHGAREALTRTEVLLDTLARRYGGSRWQALRTLLVAHLRSLKP